MNSYKRNRLTKTNFGIAVIAGALVFLLNLFFGIDARDNKPNTQNTESQNVIVQEETSHSMEEIFTEATETLTTETMTVHFLDVDQGLCILVQLGDEVLIYDGGERDTSSFVVAYLQEQGITKIDYMISSHYDSDHVSGLIGCLNVFDVECVIGSDYVHDSKLYTSFMDKVEEEGLQVQRPAVGTQYQMGEAVITILAPAEIKNDSNANSVAIKLTYGDMDFIFTGDADYASEKAMVQSGIDLDVEVLSLGHHGSASSSSSIFLEATTPEYAVISCGKDNGYGHPHEEVVELLEVMEIDVFRSDMQGTVTVTTDGKTLLWSQEPCNDYSDGN